jgi:hypothetical protein
VTLAQYAAALEKSTSATDRAMAEYIRTHEVRLRGWIDESLRLIGGVPRSSDREDLTQVAMLAIAQVVLSPDIETALTRVRSAVRNNARAEGVWNSRKLSSLDEEV